MRQWATSGNDIAYGRQVSAGTALAQRHEHMLENIPGDLGSDPEWGIGIRQYRGRTTALTDVQTLADVFRAQHLSDPETADADIEIDHSGTTLVYEGRFMAEDGITSTLSVVIT